MREQFGCVGNSIRLRSGRYFDLANPQPDCFTVADIAGALSKICRFGGQISRFYSVAEHCCNCWRIAVCDGFPPAVQLACLLHDAAEAFIGDVVKPLKIMLPEYAKIESRIEGIIAEKYCVCLGDSRIREIDHAMLIAERKALFSKDDAVWCGEKEARRLMNVRFGCMAPPVAEAWFEDVAEMLFGHCGLPSER